MLPELGLVAILFTLLLVKISGMMERTGQVANLMNILLPLLGVLMLISGPSQGSIFGGMMVSSSLVHYEKIILLLGVWLISLQSSPWLKGHKHAAEFYMLVVAVLTGMFFLLSSGDFLLFYLALELTAIPLAALCNFDLEKSSSGEAAMKMIFSSAFSSGLLLFGISMFYGTTGTLNFAKLPELMDGSGLQLMSFLLIFTGFAFKLSLVPFHFWTADVYEGSPLPVTAFLSVISKGVMAFVLVNVLYTLFHSFASNWYDLLTVLAVVSMTFGNLMAIRQQNLKRLLAFSSIAQVGYLMLGISGSSAEGMTAVVYFILIYIFSNLAAFGVIGLVTAGTSRENIDGLKGFYSSNPLLSWVLALALFSLAGIPPTSGFFGKFFLLTASASKWNSPVLIIAALNMVISLYYYLRIIRAIFMDAAIDPMIRLRPSATVQLSLFICVSGILLLGFYPAVYEWIRMISFGI